MKNRAIAIAASGVTVALAGFVAHWEGTEFTPYRDIGGVWTVCEGITGPAVIPGKTYSRAECRDLLNGELMKHAQGLSNCLRVTPPRETLSALISWAYNVGVGAACRSTLVSMVNQGRFEEACRELLRWDKLNGTPVRGLSRRRAAEMQWCLRGLRQ
jgi:lysozyme